MNNLATIEEITLTPSQSEEYIYLATKYGPESKEVVDFIAIIIEGYEILLTAIEESTCARTH